MFPLLGKCNSEKQFRLCSILGSLMFTKTDTSKFYYDLERTTLLAESLRSFLDKTGKRSSFLFLTYLGRSKETVRRVEMHALDTFIEFLATSSYPNKLNDIQHRCRISSNNSRHLNNRPPTHLAFF